MNSQFLTTAAMLLMLAGCKNPFFQSALHEESDAGADRISAPSEEDFSSTLVARRPPVDHRSDEDEPASAIRQTGNTGETLPPGRHADGSTDFGGVGEHLNRGHAAAAEGNLEQAAMHYQRVLQEEPNHPQAHHRLGVIADKQEDYEAAQHHYLTALRIEPEDADLFSDLGYSYLLQEQFAQSEQALKEALRLEPAHTKALNNLGLLYGMKGDYEGALATFRRAGTEEEAQAKVARLFPQGPPSSQQAFARAPHEQASPEQTPSTHQALHSQAPQSYSRSPQSRDEAGAFQAPQPGQVPDHQINQKFAEIDGTGSAPAGQAGMFPGSGAQSGSSAANPSHHVRADAGLPHIRPGFETPVDADPLDSMPSWPPAQPSAANQAAGSSGPWAEENHQPHSTSSGSPSPVTPTAGQGSHHADFQRQDAPESYWPHAPHGKTEGTGTFSAQGVTHANVPQQSSGTQASSWPESRSLDQAQRTATAIGMDAGPGGMFPMVNASPSPQAAAQPGAQGEFPSGASPHLHGSGNEMPHGQSTASGGEFNAGYPDVLRTSQAGSSFTPGAGGQRASSGQVQNLPPAPYGSSQQHAPQHDSNWSSQPQHGSQQSFPQQQTGSGW